MKEVELFRKMQEAKVSRAERLLGIVTRIGAAEVAGQKEVMQKGLVIIAEHLPLLLEKMKAQKGLCGVDNQCHALLDEEINALEGRVKELGNLSVIHHVIACSEGRGVLNVPVVSSALLLVMGRQKSLDFLYSSA